MRRIAQRWLLLITLLILAAHVGAAGDRDVTPGSFEDRALSTMAARGIMPAAPYGNAGLSDVTRRETVQILSTASRRSLPAIKRPHDRVNVAEFLKLLTHAFGEPLDQPHSFRDVPSNSWYGRYAGVAARYQLFPYRMIILNPSTPLTRTEVAVALEQYFSQGRAYDDFQRSRFIAPPRYPRIDTPPIPHFPDARSCPYDPYIGGYRCPPGPSYGNRICYTDMYGRTSCRIDDRSYRSSSSSSRRQCPDSFSCTAYDNGNYCAVSTISCGLDEYPQCVGRCGTFFCGGDCCRCVPRYASSSSSSFSSSSSSTSSSSFSSSSHQTCPMNFACTAFPNGNQCAMAGFSCQQGFRAACQGMCGTPSCTGSCCRCVPNATTETPVQHVEVAIRNFAYAPFTLQLHVGDTVTWVNQDSAPHTVTGETGGPASPVLNPGQSYTYTFRSIGSFAYDCHVHPSMPGGVVTVSN